MKTNNVNECEEMDELNDIGLGIGAYAENIGMSACRKMVIVDFIDKELKYNDELTDIEKDILLEICLRLLKQAREILGDKYGG